MMPRKTKKTAAPAPEAPPVRSPRAAKLLRELSAAARRSAGKGIDRSLDALFACYESLAESSRQQLRDAYRLSACASIQEFWYRHESQLLRFRREGDPQDLLRALAHYSLCDGAPDARDAVLGMRVLVAAAEAHGVEWRPVFARVARSAGSSDTGIGPMRKLMTPAPARTGRPGRG